MSELCARCGEVAAGRLIRTPYCVPCAVEVKARSLAWAQEGGTDSDLPVHCNRHELAGIAVHVRRREVESLEARQARRRAERDAANERKRRERARLPLATESDSKVPLVSPVEP